MGIFSRRPADGSTLGENVSQISDELGQIGGLVADQTHANMSDFHQREIAKYEARAQEREAKGDHKGAARARKVVERNRRLAAKHTDR